MNVHFAFGVSHDGVAIFYDEIAKRLRWAFRPHSIPPIIATLALSPLYHWFRYSRFHSQQLEHKAQPFFFCTGHKGALDWCLYIYICLCLSFAHFHIIIIQPHIDRTQFGAQITSISGRLASKLLSDLGQSEWGEGGALVRAFGWQCVARNSDDLFYSSLATFHENFLDARRRRDDTHTQHSVTQQRVASSTAKSERERLHGG